MSCPQAALNVMQLGPYSAWITIDGVVQPAYDVRVEDNGSAISCWIASEQGKKFAVNWHNALRDMPIEAVIKIDGLICNRHIMLDKFNFPDKPNAFGVSYARTSEFTRRDFVFSTIQVTDDDSYLDTLVESQYFGIIEIQLWRTDVSEVTPGQPLVHEYGNPVLEEQIVHERSKKAGTHHVKYGEEYVVPPMLVDLIRGYRWDPLPFLTMTFRYRPISMPRSL